MNAALPTGAVHYATSRFTDQTLPEKFRNDHSTKAGVWGLLVVETGQLLFHREGSAPVALSAGDTTVFGPQEVHAVEPQGTVEFEVRFHRQEAPDAA